MNLSPSACAWGLESVLIQVSRNKFTLCSTCQCKERAQGDATNEEHASRPTVISTPNRRLLIHHGRTMSTTHAGFSVKFFFKETSYFRVELVWNKIEETGLRRSTLSILNVSGEVELKASYDNNSNHVFAMPALITSPLHQRVAIKRGRVFIVSTVLWDSYLRKI